jgi:cytochrome c oxidase assembly protein subunit 15
MGIICYALWFALQLMVPKEKIIANKSVHQFYVWMIVLMTLQLIYGAFMAGLKAAPYAPTWPDINGKFFPDYSSHVSNIALFDNPYLVHFIHRSLAYIIVVAVLFGWWKYRSFNTKSLFGKTKWLLPAVTLLQLILGIFTVINAPYPDKLLWLGTAHQFVAMLLLLALIWTIYIVRNSGKEQ